MTDRIAGEVAADIASVLAEPVRALRDRLGLVVDHLERHVATSTGPAPYPWRSLQSLRQDLGGAYLEATTLARRIEELESALAAAAAAPDWFELAGAVDHGLRLANHHIASGIELMIDLGSTPRVRGTAGTLALVVAQLVAICADSARALPNSTLSVRTMVEQLDGETLALIQIIDNGSGSSRAVAVGDIAREITAAWGTQVDATSEPDHGCAFELRLVTST
ncbi:MAG: HAMP domain-containing histidine kinase [Deltaproteobacteria bacterium]|nr:HAMP domain-containing histidine kinase [Deltaproteobacteria bacterium]